MMFSGVWKDAWSTAIVNHLWQSTLAMMVAWLLTLILRNNQARTRYWIWMAASLKLLIPFSLLAAIGDWLSPVSVHPVESHIAVHHAPVGWLRIGLQLRRCLALFQTLFKSSKVEVVLTLKIWELP